MPEQSEGVLDQLRRSNRRWKRLALASLAMLVLAVAGWMATAVLQMRQAAAARDEAEQARQEAVRLHEAEKAARQQAQQILYFSHIALAEKELAQSGRKGEKP
jgi:hypothetical protein